MAGSEQGRHYQFVDNTHAILHREDMIIPANRKQRVVVFVISVLALIIGLTLLWGWQTGRISFKAASDQTALDIAANLAAKTELLEQEIDAQSAQLLEAFVNYQAADGKAKDQLVAKMQQIAKTRQQKLRALLALADDPGTTTAEDGANGPIQLLGQLSFPNEIHKELVTVPGLTQYLETSASLSGLMTVEVVEGLEDIYRTEYAITTADEAMHELRFGINPGLMTGDQVTIIGVQIDSVIIIGADSTAQLDQYLTVTKRGTNFATENSGSETGLNNQPPDVLVAPATTKRVAVVAFNFANSRTQPVTTAKLRQFIFTGSRSAKTWFNETSEGKLELTGDVYGYYATAGNYPTACNTVTRVQMTRAAERELARSVGIGDREPLSTLSEHFDYFMFIFPAFSGNNCGFAAAAPVGGNRSYYPVQSFMQGYDSWTRLPVHELGHNFGLDHAQAFDCRDSQNRRIKFDERSTCYLGERDDLDDVMGGIIGVEGSSVNSTDDRHFSGSNLNRLGWLPNQQIQNITQSGTYTLYPSNRAGTGIRLLRLPNTQVAPVYIEYRRPSGIFDNYSANATSVNGLLVRRYKPVTTNGITTGKSQLLYAGGPHNPLTSYEAALPVNKTLTLDNSGVYIRTVSLTNASAQVEVTYVNSGACTTQRWEQSVTPASASVISTSSPTKLYQVGLRNTNQGNCQNSQAAPTVTSVTTGSNNLTKTVNPPTLSLAPAGTGSTTVSITARPQAALGRYALKVKTIDPQNPSQPVESNVDFWVMW